MRERKQSTTSTVARLAVRARPVSAQGATGWGGVNGAAARPARKAMTSTSGLRLGAAHAGERRKREGTPPAIVSRDTWRHQRRDDSPPTAPHTGRGKRTSGDIRPILDPVAGRRTKWLKSLALPRGLEPLFSP